MTFQYSDSPERDYDAFCIAQDKAMEKLPECCHCGERIEDERCYDTPFGIYCEKCMDKYKVWTEDVINE